MARSVPPYLQQFHSCFVQIVPILPVRALSRQWLAPLDMLNLKTLHLKTHVGKHPKKTENS